MNYEIGSVAELISGLRTPNRERAICRAVTPRKKPQEEAVTPQDTPLPRIRVSKKGLDSLDTFDSPKSVPKKRALKLADNFRFLSQMSDDDEPITVNSSSWNSDEFVREYYEDKNGIRKILKGGEKEKKPESIQDVTNSEHQIDAEESTSTSSSKKSKKKKKEKKLLSSDELEISDEVPKKTKRKHCDSSEKENGPAEEKVCSKKSKKTKTEINENQDTFQSEETVVKKKKKSRQNIENDTETLPVESEGIDESEDEENEELTDFQKAAQRRIQLKAKRDLKYEPDEINRTIFIGNIPVSVLKGKYKKTLRGIFSKHGEIESIRVRSVPVEDIKTRPKVAFIEKKFHPERTTASAYIKFKEPSAAKKALVENNTILEGNHIRVDSCDNKKHQTDSRKTLFLGNLPFNIEEETVRELFEKCGSIQYVRLIRDRKTQIGKGFGFVNFEKAEGVEFALMLTEDDLKINGKVIRIKRYNTQPNNDNYRPDSNNRMNESSKNPKAKFAEKAMLNSKKRDSKGNKIRRRDVLGEKIKKVKSVSADVNGESENNNYNDEINQDVPEKPSKDYESFKGLIAKKKKKNKINKGALKKKKISKLLMPK